MVKRVIAGAMAAGAVMAGQLCLAAEPPQVVVSIKPIHSLVAAVMQGSAEPKLLIPSGASPHTYSLKPSDARALQQADLVFWVGDGLETFLLKPLAALPARAQVVELAEAPGVTLLPYREDGPWEAHDHAAGHADAHDHGRVDKHEPHDEGHDHEHEAGKLDMHVWLDAGNAQAMVRAAAAALTSADPERAETYAANAERTIARLQSMDGALRAELTPLAGRAYVVFHDAYQYLEHRYGLTPAGSITVSPERQPSAQRVRAIRAKVAGAGAVCVFSEPQFEPALVKTLIEGTPARTGVLDPDGGIGIPPGPDAYFTMMQDLGNSMRGCLAPGS